RPLCGVEGKFEIGSATSLTGCRSWAGRCRATPGGGLMSFYAKAPGNAPNCDAPAITIEKYGHNGACQIRRHSRGGIGNPQRNCKLIWSASRATGEEATDAERHSGKTLD